MLMLTCLRDVDAIESDVTFTEEGVEEIICHARVVRKVNIISRARYKLTSDIQFDI